MEEISLRLKIRPEWLREIRIGRKITEGRAGPLAKYERYVGKLVEFISGEEYFICRVGSVRHYQSTDVYLYSEGWKNAAPQFESFEAARAAFAAVYTDECINDRGGICALELKLLPELSPT